MTPEVLALMVPFAGIAMIVAIVWIKTREEQAKAQARAELHKHLLDRFGSGTELAQFLETEGGKQLIESLGKGEGPKERALKLMIMGAVSTCLGVAFLVLTYFEPDLVFPGGILLAIGIGLLTGAVVLLRLSKRWEEEKRFDQADRHTVSDAQSVGGSHVT